MNAYCLTKPNVMAQHVILACLSMAGSLMTTSVFAQQAPQATSPVQSLGDIVVTARKRDEKLLEVPISVVAFSEKELRASGTNDLLDLKGAGGFNFNQGADLLGAGRSNGIIVFRGLRTTMSFPTNSSGSLFIDGIYVSSGQASVNTVDVARVEVLKGPQNAFFGRSTFGGAVNFVTKNPSDSFQGNVNLTATSKGSSDVDATIEGPLVQDLLKGRLTVVSHDKAAQYTASDGGKMGAENTKSITGTLYATPTDKLWLRARLHYQQDDDSSPSFAFLPAGNTTNCVGKYYNAGALDGSPITYTPGVPFFCGSIPTMDQVGTGFIDVNTTLAPAFRAALTQNTVNDQFLSKAPKLDHMGLRRDAIRASLQGGYELPYNADWAFNIGYNKANSVTAWDLDRSKTLNFMNISPTLTHDLTLDTRFSTDKSNSLRAVIGASYFSQVYQLSQIDWNLAFGAPAPTLNVFSGFNSKSKVPAVYGSLEYDVLSNLTVAAETRYQRDEVTNINYFGTAQYTSVARNWLPRVSIKFKPNEDTMIYASAAKGVQPLQLNSGYINASAAGKAYLSSFVPGATEFTPQPKIKSYEIGIKQKLLNNQLQYALTAYSENWDNRLTPTGVFNPPACVAAGISNTPQCPLALGGSQAIVANDAKIKGVEFSADALVTPEWTVGLNLNYTNAKSKTYYFGTDSSFSGVGAINANAYYFNGRYLNQVPDWTAALNSTYRTPRLIAGWDSYVRGDVTYTGRAWESDVNYAQSDPFYRVNLRVGIERKDLTLELFVKNLFDDNHWDSVSRNYDLAQTPLLSFSAQGVLVQPPDQRQFGIRVAYKFQ